MRNRTSSFAESVISQQLAVWQLSQAGQSPESSEQRLSTLQAQLAVLQSKYTDDHPDVIKMKNDIAAEKKRIELADQKKPVATDKPARAVTEPLQVQQLRAQVHQYEQVIKERTAQQENIQSQIALYQARVQSTPGVEQEYKEVTLLATIRRRSISTMTC